MIRIIFFQNHMALKKSKLTFFKIKPYDFYINKFISLIPNICSDIFWYKIYEK